MISSVKELEYAALEIRKNLLKLCSIQAIHIDVYKRQKYVFTVKNGVQVGLSHL